jgi:hypothetical protein
VRRSAKEEKKFVPNLVSGCRTTTTRRLFRARVLQSRLIHLESGLEVDRFRENWPHEYEPTLCGMQTLAASGNDDDVDVFACR